MDGNPNLITILVIAIVVVAMAITIVFIVRRQRYIRSLTDKGWQFVNSPPLEIADGLNLPPFGLGFRRETDEQVIGSTRSGVSFQVFDYKTTSPKVRVATMNLPFPMPEFYATSLQPRAGIEAATLGQQGSLHLFGDNVTFAEALMPLIGGPLLAFGASYPVDLSVDGAQLVMLGAPTKADELDLWIEALAPIAQAMHDPSLHPFGTEPAARGFTFYRHPDWRFLGDDDSMLDHVRHSGGGHAHRAHDVVTGDHGGLTFIGLQHTWETTRTETYTDSEGRTQTRTVTDHHSENILQGFLPFTLPYLAVGADAWGPGWFKRGGLVEYESEDFNNQFDVRAENPKFASDVIHPRQMEFLQRVRPVSFEIDGSTVILDASTHSQHNIAHTTEVFRGFLSRIPSFVWADSGITPPDFKPTL